MACQKSEALSGNSPERAFCYGSFFISSTIGKYCEIKVLRGYLKNFFNNNHFLKGGIRMNLKTVLLEQMAACHDQKNWFVPLHVAIDGLSAEQAAWKTGDSNSIWQIVNHLIFWNERYLNRFKGIPLTQEEVNNDATFDSTNPNGTNEEWQSVVSQLHRVMSDWADAIKECDEEKLQSAAYKESDAPWSSVIANLIIHNAYHIGQIVEIRKTQGVWDSKNGVN
jgi:uncharacterized damage-inducible protein DinB